MTAWRHPSLGLIELIPLELRPKKVWRHLYEAAEHWERICDLDIARLRTETEAAVGSRREHQSELPRLESKRWRRARDLLVRHHDAAYAPTYRNEMAAPETDWTPQMDSSHRLRALTPRSVFVVVQLGQPSCVVTAFRPHPPTQGVSWDEAEIRFHARRYFRNATAMYIENLAPVVTENLQRASSKAPDSVSDLWWLTSAVGYGRLLTGDEGVRDALPAAEQLLREVDEEVAAKLRESLDWEGCLARLADALKDTRPEDLEAVLADSEELLAVAGALGEDVKAEAFCDEAEALIPWIPPEWGHLIDHAASRRQAFDDEASWTRRLWSAVEDAALGAVLREAKPAVRPTARLVDALIPDEPSWICRWRERLAQVAERTLGTIHDWPRALLDGVTVVRPAPALGATDAQSEPWEVRGRPPTDALPHRIFVIDADNEDGYEVTERFDEDGDLWRIEKANDRALIIVIASEAPLAGEGLDSVLANAADREDAFVEAREVQPTQVTKASR